MHFGKSLLKICDLSDPEWGPYWINYKALKRKIKEIVDSRGGTRHADTTAGALAAAVPFVASDPQDIAKSVAEVEFFRVVRAELRKATDFFAATEKIFLIRYQRVRDGLAMLQRDPTMHDKNTWSRLLHAIVKFYRDALMLENFAIMNFAGFSKILKKHDKVTGFCTRDAFMRNVMSTQNITHYPCTAELLRGSEKLFTDIQQLESCMPLQDEERLFIETMRELNRQASRIQAGEQENFKKTTSCSDLQAAEARAAGAGGVGGAAPAVVTEEDAAAGGSPLSTRSVTLVEGSWHGRTAAAAWPSASPVAGSREEEEGLDKAATALESAQRAALAAAHRLAGLVGLMGEALDDDLGDVAAAAPAGQSARGRGGTGKGGGGREGSAAAGCRGRRRGAPPPAAAADGQARKRVK